VEDLEESVEFYTDILGLKEVRRFSPYEGMTIVFLKGESDGMIELIEGVEKSEPEMKGRKGLFLVGLEVSDMDKTAKELQEKGIKFVRGPIDTPGGTKIAFLKDPNDVEIELIQH